MVTAVLNNVSVFRLATFKRTHKILVGRQSMREGGERRRRRWRKMLRNWSHFILWCQKKVVSLQARKTCMAYVLELESRHYDADF